LDGLTVKFGAFRLFWPVLNLADPGSTPDNADAAAALADHPHLTLIDSPIRRRKAFANATGQGLSVEVLSPRDAKACEEITALVRNAFAVVNHCMAMENT
jgi:chromosome partitioning protein